MHNLLWPRWKIYYGLQIKIAEYETDIIIETIEIKENKNEKFMLYGGNGKDTIINNAKVYRISGSYGDDRIVNNGVANEIWGGSGDDTIINNKMVLDNIKGNDGNDIIPIKYTDVEYMCNERDGTHWFKVQQDKGGTLPLDSRGGQIPES